MIDDLSVVQTFVRRKNEGKRAQSGAGPGMIAKHVPSVLAHSGAFADGDFEGLHRRKTFEDLAHSQPGYEQEGQEQDDATSQNVPASSAPQDHEQGEDPDFGGKAEHAAAGSGEEKGANGQQPEDGHEKSEGHHKPHETAPIFGGAKGLAGEKQKDGVGEQELQFESSAVRRSGAVKNDL